MRRRTTNPFWWLEEWQVGNHIHFLTATCLLVHSFSDFLSVLTNVSHIPLFFLIFPFRDLPSFGLYMVLYDNILNKCGGVQYDQCKFFAGGMTGSKYTDLTWPWFTLWHTFIQIGHWSISRSLRYLSDKTFFKKLPKSLFLLWFLKTLFEMCQNMPKLLVNSEILPLESEKLRLLFF